MGSYTSGQKMDSTQSTVPRKIKKFEWRPTVYTLDENSDEFKLVQRLCLIPYKIVTIRKITSSWLYLRYVAQKANLFVKNKVEAKEEMVFHGSNQDPLKLLSEEAGFDTRVDNASWGTCLAFSPEFLYADKTAYNESSSIYSVVLGKILLGDVRQIDQEKAFNKHWKDMQVDLKGCKPDLLTAISNKTQRVYIYYENYNFLPLYIVSYDRKQKCEVKYPTYWVWKDSIYIDRIIPTLKGELHMQYRKGMVESKHKFKLLPLSENEHEFEIKLEKNKLIMYDLDDNKKQINLELRTRKDTPNLMELFYKGLIDDLKQLIKINNSDDVFPNEIKKEILDAFDQLEKTVMGSYYPQIVQELDKTDNEYLFVENNFKETLATHKVIKVEKIHNQIQEVKYITQKILIGMKSASINEKFLFHGTYTTKPELIYNDVIGFDMKFAKPKGYWGKGNYFAKNAFYSHDYAYPPNGNVRQMFLANLILGIHNTKDSELYKNHHTKLKRPPTIPNSKPKESYDSVYAFTNSSEIYILYENGRAYPTYLITYEAK